MGKLLFESQACTRCHGSGRYSFNMRHGSMCYGCGGRGEQLTKRGAEAQRFFRELSTVKVADLKPGDVIRATGITRGGDSYSHAATVVEVLLDDPSAPTCVSQRGDEPPVERRYCTVRLTSKLGDSTWHTFPTSDAEIVGGDRQARRERALAYQATLTKAGKPARRSRGAEKSAE
jgi:hypothetical protein